MLLNKIQAQLDFHQKNLKEKTRRKYIEPPFSVLDTKLKSWQERRNIWYQLGIQSELGRGKEYTGYNSFGDWIIQKGWTEKGSFVGQEKKLKTKLQRKTIKYVTLLLVILIVIVARAMRIIGTTTCQTIPNVK